MRPTVENIVSVLKSILLSRPPTLLMLGENELQDTASLRQQLGFDSIAFLEYLMDVEERLCLNLDYERLTIDTIDTIAAFSAFIYESGGGQP